MGKPRLYLRASHKSFDLAFSCQSGKFSYGLIVK
jgi:hypothetical protein